MAQWAAIAAVVALVPLAYWRSSSKVLRWSSYPGAFVLGCLVGVVLYAGKAIGLPWVSAFGIFAVLGHHWALKRLTAASRNRQQSPG